MRQAAILRTLVAERRTWLAVATRVLAADSVEPRQVFTIGSPVIFLRLINVRENRDTYFPVRVVRLARLPCCVGLLRNPGRGRIVA